MNPSTCPFVMVQWHDAHGSATEDVDDYTIDTFHQPATLHTAGWLLKDDERGVTIGNEWTGETFRGRSFIPAGMVQAVWTIAKSPLRPRKKLDRPTPPVVY